MSSLFGGLIIFCALHLNAQSKVTIDDRAMYDAAFLAEVENGEYYQEHCETVELSGGLLIMNGNDTVYFPIWPEIGSYHVFTGRKGDLFVALKVKRINYTSIDYQVEMVEFGVSSHTKRGIGTIGSHFFFGSEIDSVDGAAYFVDEYYDSQGECYCSVRIGETLDTVTTLASVKSNCNGDLTDLGLDNFPKLRLK